MSQPLLSFLMPALDSQARRACELFPHTVQPCLTGEDGVGSGVLASEQRCSEHGTQHWAPVGSLRLHSGQSYNVPVLLPTGRTVRAERAASLYRVRRHKEVREGAGETWNHLGKKVRAVLGRPRWGSTVLPDRQTDSICRS